MGHTLFLHRLLTTYWLGCTPKSLQIPRLEGWWMWRHSFLNLQIAPMMSHKFDQKIYKSMNGDVLQINN